MVTVSLELSSALYGALYASVFAGAGYLKSRRREGFAPAKFLRTVLLGALIGAIAGGMGLDLRDLGIEDLLLVGRSDDADEGPAEGLPAKLGW